MTGRRRGEATAGHGARAARRPLASAALAGLLLGALTTGCLDEKTGEFYGPAEFFGELLGSIEGRVVDEDGEGLSGVTITRSDGTTDTAVTDGQGNYAFPNVSPGPHTVTITPPSGRTCTPGSRNVNVSAGGAAQADFTCVQVPGSINGRVQVDSSTPVPQATVTLTGDGVERTTQSGSDGSFSFGDVSPGSYTVSATATGKTCTSQTATVSPGQPSSVTIPCQIQPGSIQGTVTVDGTGRDGIAVELFQGGQRVAGPIQTSGGGTYAFSGLAPGGYQVRITPPSGVTCDAVEKSGAVQPGQPTTVDFACSTESQSQIPSRSELAGDYQGTYTPVSQSGSCPSPLSGSFTGSVGVNGEVSADGFDPQVPTEGTYDEASGDLATDGMVTLPNSFTIQTTLILVAAFDAVRNVLLSGRMRRVHRDPGGSQVCEEGIDIDATQVAMSSSARFKRGVVHVLPDGRSVLGLKPVAFRYRAPYGDPDAPRLGLIAEEVAVVYPEAVGVDAEGRPNRIHARRLGAALLDVAGAGLRDAVDASVARIAGAVRGVTGGP